MIQYKVSAFNHCNNMVLKDHTVYAKDFWEASDIVDTILKESGYSHLYMTISIKEVGVNYESKR